MEEEMKRFLQSEMKKEADRIMKEVEADKDVADLKAPKEIHEKLLEQIEAYEKEKERRSFEEKDELLRLRKFYKRSQKRRKYAVVAAAAVFVLAFGITSVGGPERLLKEWKWVIGSREQTNTGTENGEVLEVRGSEEEEAYQKIKDEFGFEPVRMYYLPEGMNFEKAIISEGMQSGQIIYGDEKNSIVCQFSTNYLGGSTGQDVEDKVENEFTIDINGISVFVKEYEIDSDERRVMATFEYNKIYYFLQGNGIKIGEFEKILKNSRIFLSRTR